MSQEDLVVRTVCLDSGFFCEENIDACEGDFLFFIVRKFTAKEDNGQGMLLPKWRYQIICHNQPKEAWKDYDRRAKIELTIRDLDYALSAACRRETSITTMLTLALCIGVHGPHIEAIYTDQSMAQRLDIDHPQEILLTFLEGWQNRSGKMIMRLMAGFPYVDVL